MKILLLARAPGWPLQDGYSLRLFHLARWLGTHHELHLLCTGGGAPAAPWTVLFRRVTAPAPGPAATRRPLAGRVMHALSPGELHPFDPQVQAALQHLVAAAEDDGQPFDALWVCGDKLLMHSERLEGRLPVLADIADDDVLARWSQFASAPALRRPRALLDWMRSLRYQRQFLRHAAETVVVAEPDRDSILRRHGRCAVAVVTNGVDHEFFAPAPSAADVPGPPGLRDRDNELPAPQLVFEGNMRFAPNVQAAVHFCRVILPLIRERVPELRVALVGRDPSPEVAALAGPGVVVTGEVEDVRPWLQAARVFVCPLLSGAGIKNKILQAWSMALPVVATRISCGGLRARPGRNLLVADAPREFADAVLALLDDPALRARLGTAGRLLVREEHGWDRSARLLEEALERVADSSAALARRRRVVPLPARGGLTSTP
ncbi:MAG TPA: glycosyltransferase family 4 protein [Planctomycetota bacterium]|nr:glycosyltransferase family 4 protein [Planctomycetota bacterium]